MLKSVEEPQEMQQFPAVLENENTGSMSFIFPRTRVKILRSANILGIYRAFGIAPARLIFPDFIPTLCNFDAVFVKIAVRQNITWFLYLLFCALSHIKASANKFLSV